MRIGEKETESETRAELATLDRMASRADDLIGGAFMIERSIRRDHAWMDRTTLTERTAYVRGARKLGSMLLNALRVADTAEMHAGAELRWELEDANAAVYGNTMAAAITKAQNNFTATKRVEIGGLGEGDLLDFRYGTHIMNLHDTLIAAGKVATNRRNAIRKATRERGYAAEEMGYMAAASIIGSLMVEAEKFGWETLSGRAIYDKTLSEMSYVADLVAKETILNTDVSDAPLELKLNDFLIGPEELDIGTIVDGMGRSMAPVSAVLMIMSHAVRGLLDRERERKAFMYM